MRFTSLILACIVLTFGIPCFANETPVSFILSPLDKLDTPTEPEVNVILTMDWKETLLSLYVFDPCANAVVLESVTVTDAPTALDAADGVLSIVVSTGTAIELHLEGRNGASDYDFSLPGVIDGIAPGHYKATVEDAGGCISEPLMVIVPYAQCCAGCGHHDVDVDGICDDSDECTNRRASNYADPSNVACIIPGCMDPDFVEYYSEATVDNGSCSTAVVNGCTDPVYSEYDSAANTDDGSCQSLLGCSDSDVSSMDGYSYGLVTIGDQCWFSENLRTTVYADGSAIPEVSDDTAWAGLSTGARCDYDNDASNVATYGRLYNWHAATASAELCPSGWHVPTDDEWTALEDYLGANGHSGAEGTALKSTSGWFDGGNGTDDFGFSALSGGYRLDYNGDFDNAGDLSFWWSSSPDGGSAWLRYLSYYDADINRAVTNPMAGYSVRCLRDADFTEVQGCTNPAYDDYDSAANSDDGSCQTLLGCSDSNVSSMDGYSYGLVTIGDQCWFSENLRTTVYADGSAIPEVTDNTAWTGLSTGARCDYGNDASNVATYGRLYNWHVVNNGNGLCPSGWHVPTDGEWTDLENYINSQGFAGAEGTALKSTSGWDSGGNGTDNFGFSALPGGFRLFANGNFYYAGGSGRWWSSSPSGGDAWRRVLLYYSPDITRDSFNPRSGFSVRCLRDADFTEVQGCTNPAYEEFNPSANADDGSCTTLILEGCTDPAYDEYDSAANSDDGSCQSLLGCTDSDVSSMDGYSYGLVTIGDQCWFSENLRTTVYADGSAIPEVTDDGAWSGLSTGARCDYDNDASNVATYGRLYNWHAATDVAELCPSGWHVPTDGEWTELEDYLGANGHSGDEGTALRSTSGWNSGGNGTDDFGFSALPGGYRSANSGNFYDAGFYGYWWSSSPSGGDAWFRYLDLYYPGIYRVNSVPRYGFSVRCLRDADFTEVQGCTDPDYEEFNPSANADDGSCQTLASNCDSPSMDGYSYAVVEIGDQCWFAENLRTSVYADGSGIPEVTDDGAWSGLSTGARCDYDNDANNVATYGRLYNWYAVNNGSGLCPSGWHVPTDGETEGELKDLVDYITSQGFGGTEGTALKSTSGWDSGGNGTDDFGFSALPGGYRSHYNSNFTTAGWIGKWWSSSPYDGDRAVLRSMRHIDSYINQYANGQGDGFSVRCLRDADFTEVQGCTNPAYAEFNPSANADDGSCTTLILEGCTDPAYDEYDSAANSDDGSCQSLLGCTDSDVSSMDGYSYGLVTIGDQCWFSENLRTTVYADGSAIPEVTDDGAWSGLSTGARCDYDNDASNVATYGRLYNWHAATDVAELCPSGWHVPTDGEWTELEDYLGANGHSGDEGTALRSTSGWNSGGNGTDDFGFSALPGGYRDYGDGSFGNAGYVGFWWSSSPSGGVAWHRNLLFNAPAIYRYNGGPRDGFSVRCLRDAD